MGKSKRNPSISADVSHQSKLEHQTAHQMNVIMAERQNSEGSDRSHLRAWTESLDNAAAFGCKGFLDMPRKIADSEPGQGKGAEVHTQGLTAHPGAAALPWKTDGICMSGNFWLWGEGALLLAAPAMSVKL